MDALSKAIEQHKKVETTRNHAISQINSLNSQIQKLQQNETNLQLKLKVRAPQPIIHCWAIFVISIYYFQRRAN